MPHGQLSGNLALITFVLSVCVQSEAEGSADGSCASEAGDVSDGPTSKPNTPEPSSDERCSEDVSRTCKFARVSNGPPRRARPCHIVDVYFCSKDTAAAAAAAAASQSADDSAAVSPKRAAKGKTPKCRLDWPATHSQVFYGALVSCELLFFLFMCPFQCPLTIFLFDFVVLSLGDGQNT